jgi:2-polyprenyl-3-methyl-5-hydroxy-6-metoxy-1,4-benzoquinol methylase
MFKSTESPAEKYQLSIFSPHGLHAKIIKWVGENKKVLDVGCATGYLGRELKKKGCYVAGIEIDQEAANKAKKWYDKIVTGDIEQINPLPFPENHFDVVVFSEVLEHLRRPDLVLFKIKKYLLPNGYVVASVPNIARIGVRVRLLVGKFEYENCGILDKTHLRFFTRESFKYLFKSAGYDVVKIDYTGLASKVLLFQLLPTLFAYNFVIVGKPRSKTTR